MLYNILGGYNMTQIINNLIYDNSKNLTVDLYLPEMPVANKILIFWHGGGWFRGDKSELKQLCLKVAAHGFLVFAPNYSLAPASTFPTAHADSNKFVKWLFNSKYTSSNITITQIGASSGGTIALYLAGKYGFPTVTWSAPVSYSSWMKNHPKVKPAKNAQKELGLTTLNDINDAFYKFFTLTYAGSSDTTILEKLDAASYNYQNLRQLLMINSTKELVATRDLLDFIATLAQKNHGIDLKLIAGSKHAMSYSKQYLDESINYLIKTTG